MYNFRDTNETSESAFLPSEALKINGEYIENQISGYRTLNVSGREALSPDVESYETGIRDGSKLKNKRYPERIITVTYQIKAESNVAFRDAYNALGKILDVTDAELIFADEPDKFFIGTPCIIGEVKPGTNSVVGEIEILCTDPFKYSVSEYEVSSESGSTDMQITYNGTYKAFPSIEVKFKEESEPATLTGNGECGYIAFFDANRNILQFGDPEEVDGEENAYPMSQPLINQVFKTADAWGTSAKSLWTLNGGSFEYQQIGTLGMKQLPNGTDYYLSPTSYGTYASGWHGASMTRTIPADASGSTTNDVFDLYFKPMLSIGTGESALQSYGEFSLILLSDDNEKVAKLRIVKNTAGRTATIMMYVGDTCFYSGNTDVYYGNKQFGAGIKNPNCRISKTSGGFVFVVGNITKTYRTYKSSSIANITKFEFMFSQYKSKPAMAYNGLLWCKFTKNYCETYKDIPNKFQPNDILNVDCRNGEIKLNNTPAPELGALGNDWETFCLKPGTNLIGFSYSDWVIASDAPSIKLRYREVFF